MFSLAQSIALIFCLSNLLLSTSSLQETHSDGFVWLPYGADSGNQPIGKLEFNFNIYQSGAYKFDLEVLSPNNGDNSFYFSIDDPSGRDIWSLDLCTNWCWQERTLSSLSPGVHILTLEGREDGTKLRAVRVTPMPSVCCFHMPNQLKLAELRLHNDRSQLFTASLEFVASSNTNNINLCKNDNLFDICATSTYLLTVLVLVHSISH